MGSDNYVQNFWGENAQGRYHLWRPGHRLEDIMAIDRSPYGVYMSPDWLIEEINKLGDISSDYTKLWNFLTAEWLLCFGGRIKVIELAVNNRFIISRFIFEPLNEYGVIHVHDLINSVPTWLSWYSALATDWTIQRSDTDKCKQFFSSPKR